MSMGASDTRGQAQPRWSEDVAFDAWSHRNGLRRKYAMLDPVAWKPNDLFFFNSPSSCIALSPRSRYPRLHSITYAVSRAARHQIDPATYITPDQSSQLLDRARP